MFGSVAMTDDCDKPDPGLSSVLTVSMSPGNTSLIVCCGVTEVSDDSDEQLMFAITPLGSSVSVASISTIGWGLGVVSGLISVFSAN